MKTFDEILKHYTKMTNRVIKESPLPPETHKYVKMSMKEAFTAGYKCSEELRKEEFALVDSFLERKKAYFKSILEPKVN